MTSTYRVRKARDINSKLGVVTTTITIPENKKLEFMLLASVERSKYFYDIATGDDLAAIRDLASKKLYMVSHDAAKIRTLSRAKGEDVEEIAFYAERLRELELALDDDTIDLEQHTRYSAERVACSAMLNYYWEKTHYAIVNASNS